MIKATAKLRFSSDLTKSVAVGVIVIGVSFQNQAMPAAANDNSPPLPPVVPAAMTPPVNDNNKVFGGPLGLTIARGEGSYGSYNRGVAGDAHGRKIDFSQMSIGEVMR
jgi:hypothetical protein